MDGEDIQADFAEEEEIDAGEAAHNRCKVLFYSLEKKKKIAHEAFSQPHLVKLLPINGMCSKMKYYLNFDEPNINFDPSHRNTLCKAGEKSVSLRINRHSGHCTVMLGCSAGGHKFPHFIIWKGVSGGRIHQSLGIHQSLDMRYLQQVNCTLCSHHGGWMGRHSRNRYN
jgi:hypothetical protein